MNLQRSIARRLPGWLSPTARRALALALFESDRDTIVGAVGRYIKRAAPDLDGLPMDLPVFGDLAFEHLAGLFSSTTLDESIISLNVRQAAYLFGFVRRTGATKVVEIGRYKGGSTLLIAAAMSGRGRFWSIDIGRFEPRIQPKTARPVEDQLADVCQRFGLDVELIVGDSRTVEVDTGELDVVFIDGDHSYDVARSDFERFGRRLRVGGALFFDDAFEDGFVTVPHTDTVGRLVREIEAGGDFRLVKAVKRLAHLERVAGGTLDRRPTL